MLIMLSKFHKINIFCSLSSRFSPSGTSLRHQRKKLYPSTLSRVTGYPTPLVSWRKSAGQLPQERMKYNNSALQILHARKGDSDFYFCSASNLLGSVEKKTLLVVVSPVRFTVTPPAKVVAWVGDTFMLNCSATIDPQRVISWKKQGCELPVGRSQQFNG